MTFISDVIYSGSHLFFYSPGPVPAVLAHKMGIWSNPLKNGLIQHNSKMNLVLSEKFLVIP